MQIPEDLKSLFASLEASLRVKEPLVIRCHDCGGTQVWKRNEQGEIETYHGCFNGKQSRESFAALEQELAQARAEIAEWEKEGARRSRIIDERTAERDLARAEIDKLRGLCAKGKGDCIYCGLPASDIVKCTSGFPGCARMDDLMAAPDKEIELELADLIIERDSLRSQLEAVQNQRNFLDDRVQRLEQQLAQAQQQAQEMQSAWRSLVGDGTDVLTPSGLKSLVEDYQQELAQKRVIERALELAVKDVRYTILRNTDEDEIKQAWLDKAAAQLEKERL